MASNKTPVLILSATCRPIAIEEILVSLKIQNDNINIIRGELTRPEIRMIRMPLSRPLSSAEDLLSLIPQETSISNEDLAPALIYSGTQNDTANVHRVINQARGTPNDHHNGKSQFANRYHASTGPCDKEDRAEDFAAGKFPIMCCTMALGLGQNWTRVRIVIQMGRADPSVISQMLGRCGRDGRPGLALMLVEPTQKGGKNAMADFANTIIQSNDDRMDALANTTVCLRVACSLDNL